MHMTPNVNTMVRDTCGQTRSRSRAKLNMTPIPFLVLVVKYPGGARFDFDGHHILLNQVSSILGTV